MKKDYLRIHYSGWHEKYDEWILKNSRRVQHQWAPGFDFRLNNRIDILDERNKWLEAKIIEI